VTLFVLDVGAGRFDFLLDLCGFFLRDAFLQRLGSAFDEGLGFGETEARNRGADFLDDADLVATGFREDGVEGRLLFGSSSRSSGSTTARSGDGDRSSGAHAPLLFE